ncbi:MAG: hypothetical protein JWO67_4467 [Streptosporangiaceae bacterium]|nr:hypothetical protein [Streptosporangiaceae bacterium]
MATVLAFHAHPDDEVLMTGGTLARAAAEGHRVVIVVATDGVMGAASESEPARMGELRASAAVLGAARVVHLGYADSGNGGVLHPDPPDRTRFVRADPQEAAERLAAVLGRSTRTYFSATTPTAATATATTSESTRSAGVPPPWPGWGKYSRRRFRVTWSTGC